MTGDTGVASLHEDTPCVACHAADEALASVHAEVESTSDPQKGRLWKTSISDDTCLSCHEHADWQALVTATEGYLDLSELTLSNVDMTALPSTRVNPHDLPPSAVRLPAATGHEDILCTDCHVTHKVEQATTRRLCIGCHAEICC
jgi:hypothetical protein